MGGRGGSGGNGQGPQGGGSGGNPLFTKGGLMLGAVAAVFLWGYNSFYTVKTEEKSVELFLGEFSSVGNPGLNFAPWPVVTYEVVPVSVEQTESIGAGARGSDAACASGHRAGPSACGDTGRHEQRRARHERPRVRTQRRREPRAIRLGVRAVAPDE